jgi:hypothetical protein
MEGISETKKGLEFMQNIITPYIPRADKTLAQSQNISENFSLIRAVFVRHPFSKLRIDCYPHQVWSKLIPLDYC